MAQFITITCPACRGPFEILSDRSADKTHCPACRTVVSLPAVPPPLETVESPPQVLPWDGPNDKSPSQLPPQPKNWVRLFPWVAGSIGVILVSALSYCTYLAIYNKPTSNPVPGPGQKMGFGQDEFKMDFGEEEFAELIRDAKLEEKLATERDEKVKSIAAVEKQWLPNLLKFAPPSPEKDGALGRFLFDVVGSTKAFAPDGKKFAGALFNGLFICDLPKGEELKIGADMQPAALAFSLDAEWIACEEYLPLSSDWKMALKKPYNHVAIWNLHSQKKATEIKHGYKVFAFRFLPDNESLLTAGVSYEFHPDGSGKAAIFSIKSWDFRKGQLKKERTIQGADKSDNEEVRAAAFSPDGEKLAIVISDRNFQGKKGAIRVLRVKDGALLRKLPVPDIYHARVFFSPDGWRLGVHHTTGPIGALKYHVKYWDLATDKVHSIRTSNKGEWPQIVFSPDGKYMVFDGFPFDVPFCVWNVQEEKIVFSAEKMCPPEAISPGGTLLLTRDGKVWDFVALMSKKK